MSVFEAVTPIERVDGDHAAASAHAHLRRLILEGVIPPETILPQTALASQLGISRTPLREAIRMLQEEGLVVAEPQKRARVAPFDASNLEATYVQRVSLEGLGALVTAPKLTAGELDELDDLLEQMHPRLLADDPVSWQDSHRRFHLLLVRGLGRHLVRSVRLNMESSERYRLIAQSRGGQRWEKAAEEHTAIAAAMHAKDGARAASLLSAHLARTALGLIAELTPAYDPVVLRASLGVFTV